MTKEEMNTLAYDLAYEGCMQFHLQLARKLTEETGVHPVIYRELKRLYGLTGSKLRHGLMDWNRELAAIIAVFHCEHRKYGPMYLALVQDCLQQAHANTALIVQEYQERRY